MAENGLKIRINGDASDFEKVLSGLKGKTKAGLADIKAGIDMTTQAVGKLMEVASKGVNYNATLEQYRTSFEVMTGSAEKAAEVVERLRTMGAKTPFETTDLVQTTQLLMQYGFTADDAIDRMSMLGDIAQGNAEAMTSIATGYAQMSSAGKVNLQDIKQMINGGFNPLQEISERTGESMESLYDRISKGTMAVSEITDSMRYATSEGGKFYQSMEKQSKTLNGQLSTLQDNANQLLGSITEGLSVDLSSNLLPLANNMIGELQSAFESGGMDGLITTATNMIPDLLGMMTGKLQDAISGLSRWLPKGVSAIMSALPNTIRSASSVIPQITSVLFETASMVISDLIGMLPELVPEILSGLASVAGSIAEGTLQMFYSVFDGVGTAIGHLNQEFIMDGIDTEALKNLDFTMEMDIDTGAATREITSAYGTIRDALQTDLLSDEQKAEILGMLGEDTDAIKAKLMEFGLSEAEAQGIATAISGAGGTILEALNSLDLGVDSATVAKWMIEANGSNVALRHACEAAGLSDEDISGIIGVYNQANGRLADESPNFAETIYEKLTDGFADDETTVNELKDMVGTWASTQLEAAEEAYNDAVNKLDPADPEYAQRLAELNAEYEAAKTEIETIQADSLIIIDNLAGQSTQSVQDAYQTIAEVETQISALQQRVDKLKGDSMSAAENAYKVVTAGGIADDETISMAVSLKFNEFKVDEQAAEDAYADTIAKLNEQLANNEITVEDYNAGVLQAEEVKAQAVEKARAAFESAYAAILKGIAESEGNAAAFTDDAATRGKAVQLVQQMMSQISSVGIENIDRSQLSGISAMLTELLGEGFTLEDMDMRGAGPVLTNALAQLTDGIDESVLSGKVQEVYAASLQQGILAGTDFDTAEKSNSLVALMSNIYSGASSGVNTAAQALGQGASASMEDSSGAKTSGQNTVSGLVSGLKPGIARARLIGRLTAAAYMQGYNQKMEIQSPSKAMKRLGQYTGEGLEIGLNESMARAVNVANAMLGGLTTSADLTRVTNVNMPELRQEISIASEQSKVPVNIDGKKVAEIQGQNNASQLAWLRARDARGYGQR